MQVATAIILPTKRVYFLHLKISPSHIFFQLPPQIKFSTLVKFFPRPMLVSPSDEENNIHASVFTIKKFTSLKHLHFLSSPIFSTSAFQSNFFTTSFFKTNFSTFDNKVSTTKLVYDKFSSLPLLLFHSIFSTLLKFYLQHKLYHLHLKSPYSP